MKPLSHCLLASYGPEPFMWDIHTVEQCHSTQDLVRQSLQDNLYSSWPCIRTEMQNNGQGRRGRVWDFNAGDLAFSLSVRPTCALSHWASISLVAGLAMIEACSIDSLQLKWPNDIIREGKKVAGILCDIEGGSVIIGIGVNLQPQMHDDRAHVEVSKNADQLMRSFLSIFECYFDEWNKNGFSVLKERWLLNSFPIGENISIKCGEDIEKGTFQGVMDDGSLLFMDGNDRIKQLSAGEIIT